MKQLPTLRQDDKSVIVGHSGAGKTTLLKYLIDNSSFQNGYIVDTVGYFQKSLNLKASIYDTGVIGKYKDYRVLKLQNDLQLNGIIRYLNKAGKPYFLFLDEVDRYSSPTSLQPDIKLFLEEGRNFNQGGIFTIRRVGFLNKSIIGNSHYLYLFKANIDRDKTFIQSITGLDIITLKYNHDHSFYVFDLFRSENLGEFLLQS